MPAVFAARGEPRSAARYLQPRCLRCRPAAPCRSGTPAPPPAPRAPGFYRRAPAQPSPGCRARGGGCASGSAPERGGGGQRGPAQCKFGQMSPLGFGLGEPTSSPGLVKWARRLQLCEAPVEGHMEHENQLAVWGSVAFRCLGAKEEVMPLLFPWGLGTPVTRKQ